MLASSHRQQPSYAATVVEQLHRVPSRSMTAVRMLLPLGFDEAMPVDDCSISYLIRALTELLEQAQQPLQIRAAGEGSVVCWLHSMVAVKVRIAPCVWS